MRAYARKKKIRKSMKIVYIIVALALFIISLYYSVVALKGNNTRKRTKQIYSYTNKFNYDYQINLRENKYMSSGPAKKQFAYVTDLIDNTDINLQYQYKADKITNLNASYSVIGRMDVVYTKDGEEQQIWSEDDSLVEAKEINKDGQDLDITENLKIDLKSKNKLLEEFKQQMGMSIDAKYSIILKVNINTEIDNKLIMINETPMIQIELAGKTTRITGENNKEATEYISNEYDEAKSGNSVKILFAISGMVIAVIILKKVSTFRTANIIKNEYRQELNRILKLCQDKVVRVTSKPRDIRGEIIDVRDFGEILKVSEELFKPIMYYDDNVSEEAWFYIVTENIVYRYKLVTK